MSRRRRALALLPLLAACGASGVADPDGGLSDLPLPTIGGVGVLPDTIARESEPPVIVPPPVNEDGTAAELVGQQIAGNRIIMLGDSILASTERRYGGEMCAALVPLGWVVEVDAEPGRFVEFGTRVLDRRLDPEGGVDWDAAVVFLGSNYRGDQADYETELRSILGRLAPRPTLLFTVTEYRPSWAEVNEVVGRLATEYENVRLVDWKTVAQAPGVLSSDRLHPTEAGERVLADLVAVQVGRAPVGEGECLRSEFTDSSAVTGTSSDDAPAGGAPAPTGGSSTVGTGAGSGGASSGSSGSSAGGSGVGSGDGDSADGGSGVGSGGGGSGAGSDSVPPSSSSPPPASTSPPPASTSPPPASTSPPPASTSPPPASTTAPVASSAPPPPAPTAPPAPASTTAPAPSTSQP